MTGTTTYKYKAQSASGEPVRGVVEAYDEFDAVARIKEKVPIVLSVTEVREQTGKDLLAPRKIAEKKLALMCSQFSIIIGAGLPMVRSVELVAEQTSDKALHAILKQVAGDVSAGNSLSDSFERKGRALPTTFIETVRAGEQSGTLDQAFNRLFTYYDKAANTRDKVTSALIYPVFLLILAVVVVGVLMTNVIPMMIGIFRGRNVALPLLTRIIIATSDFMVSWWFALLGAIVILVIAALVWSKTPMGMKFFALFRLKFPVAGTVERMNGAFQFANTTATLLAAGMPMPQTLDIVSRVLDNYVLGLYVRDMVSGVEEGRRLGDCLKNCPWFPPMLIEMTGVGEETGSLEHTLNVIGDYYDNEVRIAITRALSMLEPAIIVVMGVFVGLIVLGIYPPMFQMYGG